MRALTNRQLGVTIIELMLVLVIGASLIMMGIRQFRIFSIERDAILLKANVNTIFQGMTNFYYANCDGNTDPVTGMMTYGKLNPVVTSEGTYPIIIESDLVTPGYLPTTLPTIVPPNALVNTKPTGKGFIPIGYKAQFNRYTQDRKICTKGTNVVNGANDANCTQQVVTGTSLIWRAQVAVKLRQSIPPEQYETYRSLTGADCLSAEAPDGVSVSPCSSKAEGDFLVWERMPSMTTPIDRATSTLSGNDPNLKQFNQLYTQYPDSTVTSSTITGRTPPTDETHYYLCGS